jgi:hypothetical protein
MKLQVSIALIITFAVITGYAGYYTYHHRDDEDKTVLAAYSIVAGLAFLLFGYYAYREYRISTMPVDPILKKMLETIQANSKATL